MKVFLYVAAALCGYMIAGMNPAITISKSVYHRDIREYGSKNPGFTNFKRTFGARWAWLVLVLDLLKAAVAVGLFALLLSKQGADFQFAAAYTGIFCMLGHAFPIQFKFKGGKGFLVCLSTVYVIDWRVGLIATGIMILLLLLTRYMSLSTTLSMALCPLLLFAFGASISSIAMTAVCIIFMLIRHKENFKRLLQGKEAAFTLKGPTFGKNR